MRMYIVKKDDTLVEIAKRHYGNASWYREIALHNRLQDANVIHEGQTLELPSLHPSSAGCSFLLEDNKIYTVRYGDTLWKIAEKTTGSPSRWSDIAKLNNISDPTRLYIGQPLVLPLDAMKCNVLASKIEQQSVKPKSDPIRFDQHPATGVPAKPHFFVLADELKPSPKLVRKDKPGLKRFEPRNMNSKVTIGRHVMGDNKSKYISTSRILLGAPRFDGTRYWIDVEVLKKEGVKMHNAKEIANDFTRIESKYADSPQVLEKVKKGRQFLKMDKEVLVEGPIKSLAIKDANLMGMTAGVQVLQGVGIIITAYDMGVAMGESYVQRSVTPLRQETLRTGGGWAGAWAGQTSAIVAGMRMGFISSATVSIETGPGALIIGVIGAIVGGFVGYYTGDWINGYIDELPEMMDSTFEIMTPDAEIPTLLNFE